jgi:hypothetical protein
MRPSSDSIGPEEAPMKKGNFHEGLAFLLLTAGILTCSSGCSKVKKPYWVGGKTLVEASEVDDSYFPYFAKWLDRRAKDPVDYIAEKCRRHDLVIIGEHHYIKDYCELFRRAVPEVYSKAGVRVIALEVCNAEDNDKISRLIEGQTYDLPLAYEIARSQNWELWGYKEYWDILEAAWSLNRHLPAGQDHLRVVGIDKKMDYQLDALWRANKLADSALIEKAKAQPDIYKRDDWLVESLEKEIIGKGAKGLVLVGLNHSFTRYAQPKLGKDLKLEREWPRMGYLLRQKYGEKVFQVALHGPQMSPKVIDKSYQGAEPVMSDLIERIMAAHGNKPVGFDTAGSPFANIRDSLSYYYHWQPRVTFANLNEGFVFLSPVKRLTPCTWMKGFISDEMFEKSKVYYEFAYGQTFQNSREVDEFLASGLKTL